MNKFRYIFLLLIFSFLFQGLAVSQLVYSGIEGEKIIPVFAERLNTDWCWAACVQLVFNSNGLELSQEDILKHSFKINNPYDSLPDWYNELKLITKNLNDWKPFYKGHRYSIKFKFYDTTATPERLKKELDNYNPVILAFKDSLNRIYPVVCSAIGFLPGYYGPVIKTLMIRDPLPVCENKQGEPKKYPISILKKNVESYFIIHLKKICE